MHRRCALVVSLSLPPPLTPFLLSAPMCSTAIFRCNLITSTVEFSQLLALLSPEVHTCSAMGFVLTSTVQKSHRQSADMVTRSAYVQSDRECSGWNGAMVTRCPLTKRRWPTMKV